MAKTKRSKAKREEQVGQADPRAPLDSAALLAASQPVLARLEADLLARAKASPAVTKALEARYEAEKKANRTAESFGGWTESLATQVAAAWLLSCVFVRTLEDRGLLKQARIAGPGAEDSQRQFFQLAPSLTERDYLLTVFRELAHHPAARDLFDAEHSLVWKLSPSAELAKELLALFRTPSASEPAFRFGQPSTRFLGDLYQDLSEEVRKRYALLQTPDFVEEFILDRTLEPAIQRFGLDDTTLIDPTCGSGHFLLGAFDRLFEHRLRSEPGVDPRVAAVKALDCVYGADINPYAVAIARFRLTLSFLEKAGYKKLADAPALPLHLVVADSLRINPQHPQQELWQAAGEGDASQWLGGVFSVEDERAAKDVLGRQYAAVVGNPPYITVKDAAMREVYRRMYASCHRSYALSVPFCERFFQLARPRGYTGQITANSFMKREFGKLLIEKYLPSVNIEGIINTAGVPIPGHGTPTVLLFGTNEVRQGNDVLTVLAKRGEPSTPKVPGEGLVWRSIVEHGDEIGFENDYISVARIAHDTLQQHPWSLGGGGVAELKELLEERAAMLLDELGADIGTGAVTREDDVYLVGNEVLERWRIPSTRRREAIVGENVRDWAFSGTEIALWPYELESLAPCRDQVVERALWPWRTQLRGRVAFGKTQIERGLPWTAYSMFFAERARTPLTIAFAFVATHNHFALKRGVTVFGRTAPIIKLQEGATEDDHFALLAYLNSSTACFWMKQVCSPKGMHNGSAANATPFLVRFEFDGTKLARLPLPSGLVGSRKERYVELGRLADALARERSQIDLSIVLGGLTSSAAIQGNFDSLLARRGEVMQKQVGVQEEIDWLVYADFGFAEDVHLCHGHDMTVELGARAFEVGQHQRNLADIADWFRWNEIGPRRPSDAMSDLVTARVELTSEAPGDLGILERPEYKRRWVQPSGKAAQFLETDDRVLEGQVSRWLESRLEGHIAQRVESISWRELKTQLDADQQFLAAYQWCVGRGIVEGLKNLIASNSVPFLAVERYSLSGMTIYEQWLSAWEQQRAEDRGEPAEPNVPPSYGPNDFVGDVYRLRGQLDVSKERFISYPGCESDNDSEPVYGWAGWDHLQRAQALASLYLKRKDGEGWTRERLTPMLAGLLELIPWVKQWHNEPSAEFNGLRMGDYYEQFFDGECRQHGLTRDDLRAWRPPKKARGKAKATAQRDDLDDNAESVYQRPDGQEGDPADAKPAAEKPPKKSRSRKKRAAADATPAVEEGD